MRRAHIGACIHDIVLVWMLQHVELAAQRSGHVGAATKAACQKVEELRERAPVGEHARIISWRIWVVRSRRAVPVIDASIE